MQNSVPELQQQIRSELKEVLRLQYLIQSELDELNALTKPDGILTSSIAEGRDSIEQLADKTGISLSSVANKKFRTNLETMSIDHSLDKFFKKPA